MNLMNSPYFTLFYVMLCYGMIGACKNCGSMGHKEKDCLDRPRSQKTSAFKTGKIIRDDKRWYENYHNISYLLNEIGTTYQSDDISSHNNHLLDGSLLSYDAKRDRYWEIWYEIGNI